MDKNNVNNVVWVKAPPTYMVIFNNKNGTKCKKKINTEIKVKVKIKKKKNCVNLNSTEIFCVLILVAFTRRQKKTTLFTLNGYWSPLPLRIAL